MKSAWWIVPLLLVSKSAFAYSHRWTWKEAPDPATLEKCVADMKAMAARRANELAVDATGPREIAFNGRSDLAQEKFVFPGVATAGGFNAVRTEGKPYDAVVTATLITARSCFSPQILDIKSDGDWVDWREGRLLWEETHGTMAQNPGVDERGGPGGKFVPNKSLTQHEAARSRWIMVIAACITGLIVLMLMPTKKDDAS